MKYILALLTLCMTSGCAVKHEVKPSGQRISIPANCVLGATLDAKACQPMSADLMKCDGVVVKFACVKVVK